ncbi:matrixin family metalloprotease [Haloferula sp.]|uniref:matrixin family metalloprotease n=1 Tax=Haloferula sp. TaxID=2497595 RepID=UPI003C73C4C8
MPSVNASDETPVRDRSGSQTSAAISTSEEVEASEERNGLLTLLDEEALAEVFQELPKHGQKHRHEEFDVPEKYRGLTLDEWVAMLPPEDGRRLQQYRNDLASLDPDLRRFKCWAPGTAPEIVAGYRLAEVEGGLAPGEMKTKATQFLDPERWTETATQANGSNAQGTPVTLTWSIVPDGTRVPGDSGSLGPSNFRAWIQGIYGGSATADPTTQVWFPLVQEAFDSLGNQCGITFVYEPEDTGSSFSRTVDGRLGTRGDIRLSARDIDGNSNTLAFAYSPGYGDIVMDSADNFYENTSSNSRRFVNVLTHEIGHAIGLAHVCPINETKLMEPFVTENFRGAQFDEFQSTQRQYGDPLEGLGGGINNDSAAAATDLGLEPDAAFSRQWLSIDGRLDSDWYVLSSPANARLTIRVVPASGTYLEGSQGFTCSEGTNYNPAIQQDLTLQVLRGGGAVQVATRDATGPGGTEVLAGVQLFQEGEYFIKVAGKAADAAQLYSMQILLESAPAGVDLQVVKTRLSAESNVGQNGNVDPDETVQLGITLINDGSDDAQLVTGQLTGPTGFLDFGGVQSVATIGSGLQSELFFTVSVQGECGDPVAMSLELQSNGGTATFPINALIGSAFGTKIEGFDDSEELPEDWATNETGRGALWEIVSTRKSSIPNSAYIAGPRQIGLSNLESPAMGIGPSGATLSFRHWYDLESGRDGAQLQASLDDGAWFDLLNSAATVIEGGYNLTIAEFGGSDIAGEQAWSANSGGFRTTTLQIPSAWSGSEIRLRWTLASDSNVASTGWWVDAVSFDTDLLACDPYLPMVSLSLEEGNLSERSSVDPLKLTLSTPLPLRFPVNVPLTLSGTAELADLTATPVARLEVGESEAVFELAAKLDRLDEGSESLTLTTPESSTEYVLDGETSYTVSVEDSEYSEWAGTEFEPGALLTGPDDDADGDGWSNVAEYLSGTNPNDPDSLPQTQTVIGESTIEIQTGPELVERDDAEIRGETSTDLINWTDEDVGRNPNGFEITTDGEIGFLRVVYEFLDSPDEE